MLDGDFRWTKDGSDADQPGTMVILHDTTLDRVTNCSGTVSSWLQSSTRDSCSAKVGGQRLMRLVDLLRYGNSSESHSPWQSRFLRSPTHRPAAVECDQELQGAGAGDIGPTCCTGQDH